MTTKATARVRASRRKKMGRTSRPGDFPGPKGVFDRRQIFVSAHALALRVLCVEPTLDGFST